MGMHTEDYLLEMTDIVKTFSGVTVLDHMNLRVKKGTVHALMGENGAGKSTLMKILSGLYVKDSGKVIFDGVERGSGISEGIKSGISMIYQELNPIYNMSVTENIFCNKELYYINKIAVDKKKMIQRTNELFKQYNIEGIDANTRASQLSVAQKQLVEIMKAIANDSKLIVMDEPTSAITERECEYLFQTIRQLKERGLTFIYITHKMDEIYKICDEITVMRDGQYVGTKSTTEITNDQLIAMMVGRELTNIYPKENVELGDTVLEVKNLSDKRGRVKHVSFSVRKGEIFGFAGLMGAGRSEIMETIFGIRKKISGDIFIEGKKVEIKHPKDAIQRKMAFLTEDRRETGCFLSLTVKDNINMLSWKNTKNKFGISTDKCNRITNEQIKKYDIKTVGPKQVIQFLSGGNQQKVLISRWLLTDPDIIIFDEPTRGIDVGSKHSIYEEMMQLVKQGKTIIMISSELQELLGMSDRIAVMCEGRMMGILDREEATQEKILSYAAGLINEEA